MRSAAKLVRAYSHANLGSRFLDVFTEEWEQYRSYVSSDIRDVSSSIRCLLPPPPATGVPGVPSEWTLPPPTSETHQAAKAIRCLLVIRCLHAELQDLLGNSESPRLSWPLVRPPEASSRSSSTDAPRSPVSRIRTSSALQPAGMDGCDPRDYPLHIAEEVVDGYKEGRSFEVGRQDRIVCGVGTPEGGRCTRYLVLHHYLLLLVQPDLVNPGWASVRTVLPVRFVEPHVDRAADPRTLRLCVRLAKGTECPGEAWSYDPASTTDPSLKLAAEELRGSAFFMLTLSFEDVRRCDCAQVHLEKQREEVRAQLRHRVEAFVDSLCAC